MDTPFVETLLVLPENQVRGEGLRIQRGRSGYEGSVAPWESLDNNKVLDDAVMRVVGENCAYPQWLIQYRAPRYTLGPRKNGKPGARRWHVVRTSEGGGWCQRSRPHLQLQRKRFLKTR